MSNVNTLEMCWMMFYFLNYTTQQDKNPLNTSDNTVLHTALEMKTTLFLAAGSSKIIIKILSQQLHNSSKCLGCNGYKLSNHINSKKNQTKQITREMDEQCNK